MATQPPGIKYGNTIKQPSLLVDVVAGQRPSYLVSMYNIIEPSLPEIFAQRMQNMDTLPIP